MLLDKCETAQTPGTTLKIRLDSLTNTLNFFLNTLKSDNANHSIQFRPSVYSISTFFHLYILHQALSCIFPIPSCSLYPLQPPLYPHPTSPPPLHPVCRLPGTDKVSWQGVGVLSFASLSGNPGSSVHATSLEQ